VAILTLELEIANLPWRKNTRTEQQLMTTFAREHHGFYSCVHYTNILYSMVSIPRRNILSTPVGGTPPLITSLPIRFHYRYNKRPKKPTLSPTTIYSQPTYLSPLPLPSHHLPIPHHQPPHHHPDQPSPPHHYQRPKRAL
jgi:hypothetical protein